MRFLITIFLIVNCALTSAQFTYLNQITGDLTDNESESVSNIEVVENFYYVFGSGIDTTGLFEHIKKFDLNGNLIDSNRLYFENEYFYAGLTKSFQWNPYNEQFVILQGSDLGDNVEGRMLTFNSELEIQDNLYFDNYTPYTYFFGFLIEPDGYVIYGETGGIPYSAGTFIMKLDFEGNVLWSELMQPLIYEDVYRNWTIEKLDYGYLITGGGKTTESDFEPFGFLTTTNLIGETINEKTMVDAEMPKSYSVISTLLSSGEFVLVQPFGYELVSDFEGADVYWSKLVLSKYNPENDTIYYQREYFDNYEFFAGGAYDIEATPDGGTILVGIYMGYYFDRIAWMLKLDSDLNQEWYQEYTYQTCNNCENTLYDVELAPDGGYIAAGSFVNYDVDPRQATWLLKVDACGDVEWQGCEPVEWRKKSQRFFQFIPIRVMGGLR